jgi:hypothetical protein
MSRPELARYQMMSRVAKKLSGKTVDRMERKDGSVRLLFTDGSGIEISNSHPSEATHLMVFELRAKKNQ